MDELLKEFTEYLKNEKDMAKNSLEAYHRDIINFLDFLEQKNIKEIRDITNTDIISYVMKLKGEGKSGATVNRRISAIRTFFTFAYTRGIIRTNPALNIKSPQIEKKRPDYLTIDEIDKLLGLPDTSTIKGKRDKAIFEILYGTGIRVSELVEMNVEDVNMRMGFCAFTGQYGKARIIPLGRPAKAAMEEYIRESREKLTKSKAEEVALFVNYTGERITRQGLWKLLKFYADKANLEIVLTPQILRHSFAAHMIQNGADLKSLQELMGHQDISTTQIYLDTTKNRIKEVYDRAHPRA